TPSEDAYLSEDFNQTSKDIVAIGNQRNKVLNQNGAPDTLHNLPCEKRNCSTSFSGTAEYLSYYVVLHVSDAFSKLLTLYLQIKYNFVLFFSLYFLDNKSAQMGVGEGKSIGEWFGPNTVAQVLKKLALFDEWNSLAVYVSMDNTVVIEDISNNSTALTGVGVPLPIVAVRLLSIECGKAHTVVCQCAPRRIRGVTADIILIDSQLPTGKMCRHRPHTWSTLQSEAYTHQSAWSRGRDTSDPRAAWRPLLLVVPLRLGINQINPVYIDAFKECFKMPQSLGALGGKPNNAYYFIGFSGDELIYLDPHTTQMFVESEEAGTVQDHTYHCQKNPNRMKILNLDPSVALGFFCKEEADFDTWCTTVEKEILKKRSLRMFELAPKHPPHWPPFIPPTKPEVSTTGADVDGKRKIDKRFQRKIVPTLDKEPRLTSKQVQAALQSEGTTVSTRTIHRHLNEKGLYDKLNEDNNTKEFVIAIIFRKKLSII
ncbi:unnamed protein product, partial [Ranitomeya imitator]